MSFPTYADIPAALRHGDYLEKRERKSWGKVKKTAKVKQLWLAYFGNECPSCGNEMHWDRPADHPHGITVDHILARSLGGNNDPDNLTCICWECNNHKSAYESRICMVLEGNRLNYRTLRWMEDNLVILPKGVKQYR
jgi:5-methylcytosine-specific restriction endonuclease McrA